MNGIGKFFLGALVAVLAITTLGVVIGIDLARSAGQAIANASEEDPEKVAVAAARIASFTPPAGYRPEYAIELAGFTSVTYTPGDDHSHLFLIQGPKGLKIDRPALEDMLKGSFPGKYDPATRMTVIEQKQVVLNGEETTFIVSEGKNHEGMVYRQLSAAFQGHAGPALVIITEPLSRWEQTDIDSFIASIQ